MAGLQTPRCPAQLNNQSPNVRDIGVDYLGERIGGCSRTLWYHVNDIAPTNEEKDHLVVAEHISETIKKIVLDKIQRVIRPLTIEPYGWYVPIGNKNMWCYLDGIIQSKITDTGILIFTGSGYGFRSEVFGTKYKPGSPKDTHLVQAWATIALFPESKTNHKLDKIEIIYYDRGQLDAVSYIIDSCPIEKRDIIQSMVDASGPNIPAPSFERVWSSREKVAKLYASKKISKDKYETWMESGIGGDWQCSYCLMHDKCKQDDMTNGSQEPLTGL